MDNFLGYNQVSIKLENEYKMAFAIEWGISTYRVMPFGLTNAQATFQRLVSHAFIQQWHNRLRIINLPQVDHKHASTDALRQEITVSYT